MTKDILYRDKAKDIGDRLLQAFQTPTGIPYGVINLKTGERKTHWAPCNCGILAEIGSSTIEFRFLSRITNDSKCDK